MNTKRASDLSSGAEGGAGVQLQYAREAHQWTQEQVASRLRLDVRLIIALEQDDYSNLPAPTFARGYLRSYARLLAIDPEPLLAGYERQGIAPPSLAPARPVHNPSRGEGLWRAFTYVVVGGLVGLVGVWWQTQDGAEPHHQPVLPLVTSEPTVHSSGLPPVTEPASINPIPADRELADLLAAGPPSEEGSALPSSVVPSSPQGGNRPVSPTPQPLLSAVTSANSGEEGVVIQVAETTWVGVQDASGKFLLNEVIKKGQNRTLRGPGPFKVRLGRVDGVTVEYNGAPFDFSAYSNRRTARFTLGGN